MDIFKYILVHIVNDKHYDIKQDYEKLKIELGVEVYNKIYEVISGCTSGYKSVYSDLLQIYEREKVYSGEYGKKRKYTQILSDCFLHGCPVHLEI